MSVRKALDTGMVAQLLAQYTSSLAFKQPLNLTKYPSPEIRSYFHLFAYTAIELTEKTFS